MSTSGLDPGAARKEFERILNGAHGYNKVMAAYVVQALTQTDPIKSAQALDNAISTAEAMAMQFRKAKNQLRAASPGFFIPARPSPGPAGALGRPPPPRVF